MTDSSSPWNPEIRQTPAGSGLAWWTQSFSWLFGDLARLGVWVAMLLCCLLILTPLHWVPLVGSVASHLLWYVFCGGLMVAARDTQRGQAPHFRDLFAGFGPRGGALIGAGVLVLAATLAVIGLMVAIGVGTILGAMAGATSFEQIAVRSAALTSIGWGSVLLLFVCLLAFIPISMAAWLAPALIMLRGAAPLEALRLSLRACRRNLGALTVYGLVGVGLALIATVMFLIGWLFLLPLIFLSTYAAYREMLGEDAPIEAAPSP